MKSLIISLFLLLSFQVSASVVHERWSGVEDAFIKVSQKSGVPIDTLAMFAGIESSMRVDASARTSSAKGLFQFTNRTWRVTVKSYGSEWFDGKPTRHDAYASVAMGAEYIKENAAVLRKRLGREPTTVELYMAHLLSPIRASNVSKMRDDSVLADFYPREARANQGLFYLKGKPVTVRQFKAIIANKVNRAFGLYGVIAMSGLDKHLEEESMRVWRLASQSFDTLDCHESKLVRDNLERIMNAEVVTDTTIALAGLVDYPSYMPSDLPSDTVTDSGLPYCDRRRTA